MPGGRSAAAAPASHDVWLALQLQRAAVPGVDGNLLAADAHALPQV